MSEEISEPPIEAVPQIRRPKYLNLFEIRLPLPGLLSILHRISGFALFLAIPGLLWLLQSSLASTDSFVRYREAIAHPLVKLMLIGLLWAFLHHLFAGLRFLLMDMHVGVQLEAARRNSAVVIVAAVVLTIIGGIWLW